MTSTVMKTKKAKKEVKKAVVKSNKLVDYDSDFDPDIQGRDNEDNYIRPQPVKLFYESDNDDRIVTESVTTEESEDKYVRAYDSDD